MEWSRTKEIKNKECSSKAFYGLGIVRLFLSFTGVGLIKGGKLMSSEWTLLLYNLALIIFYSSNTVPCPIFFLTTF